MENGLENKGAKQVLRPASRRKIKAKQKEDIVYVNNNKLVGVIMHDKANEANHQWIKRRQQQRKRARMKIKSWENAAVKVSKKKAMNC